MQENKQQNANLILKRLMKALRFKTAKELSNALNISESTISSWKIRGIGDYELLFTFCEDFKINLHWLLTGDGEMLLSDVKQSNIKSDIDDYKEKYYKKLEELDICKSKIIELQEELFSQQGNEDIEYIPTATGKNVKTGS